jgi:chemotaxis protein MotB
VGDYARVQTIRQGEQATRGGVVYFPEGSAELTEEHQPILRATAEVIGGKPQKVEIRGHTSTRPLPPDSSYRDHWDLAYARCRKVMQLLIKLGIDSKRMRIAVAADNEPVYGGTDPQRRLENSRVEVFMLNELAREPEGTGEERQQGFSDEGAP